jgi:hypothetical protein
MRGRLACAIGGLMLLPAVGGEPGTVLDTHRPEGVAVELGATNQEHGLRQFNGGQEHHSRVLTVGGRECRATDRDHGEYYLDFDVDDTFLRNVDLPVRVIVEYWDEGHDAFRLKYDSTDPGAPDHGVNKLSERLVREDTRTWRKHEFRLPDAHFGNRCSGGDFVIDSEGYVSGQGDVCVALVQVVLGGVRARTEPAVVAADAESRCRVDVTVVGPTGPVEDGTPVHLWSDLGSVTPVAATRAGVATATFIGGTDAGVATVWCSAGDDGARVQVPVLEGAGEIVTGRVVARSLETTRGLGWYSRNAALRVLAPGDQTRAGRPALKLAYDFLDAADRQAGVGLYLDKSVLGLPHKVALWVYGDTGHNSLQLIVSDAAGQFHGYLLGYVNFDGWQLLEHDLGAPLYHWGGPNDGVLRPPVRLSELRLVPYFSQPQRKLRGAVELQDLTVESLVPLGRSLHLEAECSTTERSYVVGQPASCFLRVCNAAPDARPVWLRWSITTADGEVVAEDRAEVVIEAAGEVRRQAEFVPPRAGPYLLRLEAETADERQALPLLFVAE